MKIKPSFRKQLPAIALTTMISAITVLFTSGLAQANDPNLTITPVIAQFPQVVLGTNSPPVTFRIKNTHGSNNLLLGSPTISGPHSSQFSIGTGNCNSATLVPAQECVIEIRYSPTSFGSKMAKFEITTDAPDTPVLTAFLSNDEDTAKQAERRLPPVLFSLDIDETMANNITHDLNWSILGYHESYKSIVALFDCTGKAPGTCGANFAENFANSSLVGTTGTNLQAGWNFNGEAAVEHHFNYSFDATTFPQSTPGNYPIVVRFYVINNMDDMSAEASLSLMVPGNLASVYYDSEGRRITKNINVLP